MSLRREVLQSFKKLHRTRLSIFEGDTQALKLCREQINYEYKTKKEINSNHEISELIQYANAVEKELRTSVIQAKEVSPGHYEAKIRAETVRLDNVPYKDCDIEPPAKAKKCGK